MEKQPKIDATLCFLVQGDPPEKILLGFKKRGFGKGKFGGFGGKIEPEETVSMAAVRELWEESGIRVSPEQLDPVGHLTFLFPAKPAWDQVVHVFIGQTWSGQAVETEEMQPSWFDITAIPYDQMWQDNAFWLPLVLAGERVRTTFIFKEDNETVETAKYDPWE